MDYYPIPMLIGMRNTWSILSRAMRFGMRRYRFGGSGGEVGGVPSFPGSLRKYWRAGYQEAVSAGEPFYGGWHRSAVKHIGGYPGKYDPFDNWKSDDTPAQSLFISGHSHILKVKYDKTLDMLHINPGAAGMSGFHKVRTLVRFVIERGTFKDLEVIELADK